MDDDHESDPETGAAARSGSSPGAARSRPPRSGRAGSVLGLPRRTLAICVCIAAVAAISAGLVASLVLTDDEPTAVDADAGPDFEALLEVGLRTSEGRPTTLAAMLDGRPMVVNLWAQSCAPCIEEMPLLEVAHQERPELAFLGVHVNDPTPGQVDRARALAARTGITFPWVQDPDRNFFFEAGATGMPTTLLLDPRGRILATRTGAFADHADLRTWIDQHRPEP